MNTTKITEVLEKNKSFFEIRTTKDGSQYMAVHGDLEVSGFTTSRTRSVVERIIKASLEAPKEPPANVAMAADKLVNYVETMVSQFGSDYVSVSATVKGDAKMTLTVYVVYYSDDKVTEWRGMVEAMVEFRGKREIRHVVKKRVVFRDNVNAFALYRHLMEVARHAYAVVED